MLSAHHPVHFQKNQQHLEYYSPTSLILTVLFHLFTGETLELLDSPVCVHSILVQIEINYLPNGAMNTYFNGQQSEEQAVKLE